MKQLSVLTLVASALSALAIPANCARAAAVCNKADRTYSNETPKVGSYMPWGHILDEKIGFPATQYVTIVNLTPHRFVLDKSQTHSYQMDVFDWDDIPQGRARQNTATYTSKAGKNAVDDNGEAYYSIQGTDKKFVIRTTTHIPDDYPRRTVVDLTGMGLGQREYLDPAKEAPVTLVITGSQSYGFVASLRYGPGNWMKGMYDVIKDRKVQHLVMPGSHDAGMSRISGNLESIGTAPNTQTQGLTIYDQLRAGSRLFDLRVGTVHQNDNLNSYGYWVMHVSDEKADVAVGNTGESLDDVISEVNRFTSENPGEIVFFRVRYLIGIRETPIGGPIYWNSTMVNQFFGKLKGVNNRCGGLDTGTKFNQQKASYFMDRNDGKGCVLFLLNGDLNSDVPQDSPADGLYTGSVMDVWDNWSDVGDTEKMANDQVADWKTVGRSGSFSNDQFLISQWLVSADPVTTTALTIEDIAILPTNPALYWMGINNMSPETWPTVVLIDYIGVVVYGQHNWDQLSAEMYTFAIGMNLYMVSENCDVSAQRSPLLPPTASTVGSKAIAAQNKALVSKWNGIIHANGTINNSPPSTLHPGRVPVLKVGTHFLNGTVLNADRPNPHFGSDAF